MKIKILKKKGVPTWQAKKLLKDLEPVIERKMITDPEFASKFRPVETYEELQQLHRIYCTEEATIITEKITDQSNTTMEQSETSPETTYSVNTDVTDPLNESSPVIRDYVLQESAYEQKEIPSPNSQAQQAQQIFNEPTNFQEAFNIPKDDGDGDRVGDGNSNSANTNSGPNSNDPKQNAPQQPAPKKEPMNPYFDEQSNQNKKKQTKRMAKYIVKAVCLLLEKGYVWYATKDINEAKIIELELKGEIDVELLLSMDENTKITAKEFFSKMCSDAKEGSKVSQDDQDELTDALTDVLMEKGIAPTPMQNLLLVGGQIVLEKAVTCMTMKALSNNVLEGLKAHQKQTQEQDEEEEEELIRHAAADNSKKTAHSQNDGNDEKYEDAHVVD